MQMLIRTKERRAEESWPVNSGSTRDGKPLQSVSQEAATLALDVQFFKTVCFTCETAVQIFLCFMDTRRLSYVRVTAHR